MGYSSYVYGKNVPSRTSKSVCKTLLIVYEPNSKDKGHAHV